MQKIEDISDVDLRALIDETRRFSLQFYQWRKRFVLRKHLDVYQKSVCPRCGGKVSRKKTGIRKRQSHYCATCQSFVSDGELTPEPIAASAIGVSLKPGIRA
jgi:formamidopyrimidine-DNA glycosylase